MPKRMTEKQLAANRRNALRSTGPRTAKGLSISRMNAMKHGILSKQVLVKAQFYRESSAELTALHRRFHDEFLPSGPLEEMLVDQIVTAHWRLRRALTAESGEITLCVDGGRRRREKGVSPTLQWMKWNAAGDPTHAMRESSIGCAVLEDFLRTVRTSVESEGTLTESTVGRFASRFGGGSNALVRSLQQLHEKQQSLPDDPEMRKGMQVEVMRFLNGELNQLAFAKARCADEEDHEEDARQAAAVLPSGEVLDKILRYETKLERQMYRAMAQLERVQRMRRGESIPAPLSVEVSDRG